MIRPYLAPDTQLIKQRAFKPPAASAPPGPPAAPTWISHTGIASWFKIDTSTLWAASGGAAPTGSIIKVDGTAIDDASLGRYTQPTADSPIVTPLLAIGTRTITFELSGTVYYTASVDVYGRLWPWKSRVDGSSAITNAAYFPPNWIPQAPGWPTRDIIPSAANNWLDGTPWESHYALNNGYSVVPDMPVTAAPLNTGSPITSLPMDASTMRVKIPAATVITLADPTFAHVQTWTVSSDAAAGASAIAVGSQTPNFAYPAGSIIPTVTSCVMCSIPGDQPSYSTIPPIGDTRSELQWIDNWSDTTLGSAISGSPPGGIDLLGNTSRTVRFWRLDLEVPATWTAPVKVQNTDQSYATPANGGTGPGTWPSPRGATTQTVNGVPFNVGATVTANKQGIAFPGGGANSNFVENSGPAVFLWGRGVNAGPNGSLTFRYQPVTRGVNNSAVDIGVGQVALGFDTGDHSQRLGVIIEYLAHACALTNGVPWLVPPGTVAPNGVIYSTTQSVYAYGVPPGTPGGGYFRTWKFQGVDGNGNPLWTCTSAGSGPWACPGNATISYVNGVATITGDTPDSGKVFGPTVKVQGAKLASAITAGQTPPFTVTIQNLVTPTKPRASGGIFIADNEIMHYSNYNSSTNVVTINKRALDGSTPADHAISALCAAQLGIIGINTGINEAAAVPIPQPVRNWPSLIGPTFNSVAGAPTLSYP